MTHRILRKSRAAAAGLLPAVALTAALTACASTPPAPARVTTVRVQVAPVGPDGSVAAGFRTTSTANGARCEPGSEVIGEAYRCFAGNGVYDPCWAVRASRPTVLCLAAPWLRTVVRLSVTGTLSAIPPEGSSAGEPWGVELAGGQRCILLQGAHSTFDGQVIDYYCTAALSLLRGLTQTGPAWRARSIVVRAGKAAAGPAEEIKTAWFGRPDTYR